jgi:histone acetyltransferase HTATIP
VTRSIHLPEPENVIALLLDEMYEVYNPTTGSIFTNFALRTPMEKAQIMNDLVVLFIASDKVHAYPRNHSRLQRN